MSSAERFVRHHKRQPDVAISGAYARLVGNERATRAFDELLHATRRRASRLLGAPVVDGRHPGIDALVNLSRYGQARTRSLETWPGTPAAWHVSVSSLARRLIGPYPVPPFVAAAGYATDDADGDTKRDWFVAHARSASFRSLDLPIAMTRRMEDIFLKSADHLPIEHATRRAELLALGAPVTVVEAALATRLGMDLHNAAFWRTVWIFFVANAGAFDPRFGRPNDRLRPGHSTRAARGRDTGRPGDARPATTDFSVKGRTVPSMLRLMRHWHCSLGASNRSLAWPPSPLRPLLREEPSQDPSAPPAIWQLMELTNAAQLRAEGSALRHCVATCAERGSQGTSRIWPLRVRRGAHVRHLLTIEVDMRRRAVIQARGWYNRPASGKPFQLLQEWSKRERLWLAI